MSSDPATDTRRVTVSRLYAGVTEAQAAIERLEQAGIPADDISLVANNSEKWFSPDFAGAAGKGAAIGAGFGGVGGLLAGLGLLAIPGLGPVVAAGWVAAAAAGAAAAGVAGSVISMLAEAGVATHDAEVYAESIRRGGSLVSVKADASRSSEVEALLASAALDIGRQRAALVASGWTDASSEQPTGTGVATPAA